MTSRSTTNPSSQRCRYYSAGNCSRGSGCNFSHGNEGSVASLYQSASASAFGAVGSRATSSRDWRPKPCHYWKAGHCKSGSDCKFSHGSEDSPASNHRRSSTSATEVVSLSGIHSQGERRTLCRYWKEGHCSRGDACWFRHADDDPINSTMVPKETAETMGRVIQGAIVTYGAGLNIIGVTTGFESCTLHVKNISADTKEDDLCALISQQGVDPVRFHLVGMRRAGGEKVEAEIMTDEQLGWDLLAVLKDNGLEVEILTHNTLEGMAASSVQDATVLTLSWPSPAARYAVTYIDVAAARAKVRQLNGCTYNHRRVKAQMNNETSSRARIPLGPDTIIISNLSPEIDDAEMVIFSGSSSVKRLESTLSLSTHEVEGHLRDVISRIAPGCVQSLGSSSIPDPNGFVSIRARFRSRDDALTVQQFLKTSEYGKDVGMWFRVPHPLDFTLSLDIEQYVAQKNQWDALMGSLKDPEACVLNIHEEGHTVRVRLSGSQKDALGALKVQVEDLARGETVQGWHRALEHPKNEFSKQVLDETGAYMRVDRKNRAITVFGSAASISRAREMISEELDRLSSADFSAIVPKPAVRSLINHGLAQLKETFGEDTIKFDMTSRRITISGGEEARHALDSIIRSAMRSSGKPSVASQSETACPICGGDISVPFHLGCGHVYCVACLRYFLLSALNAPDFPLRCLGNDGRCGVPIPIPTIHRFLPPASFNRLLEAAFTTYLVKHANEFKYCKTPDCTQIYRSTSSEAPVSLRCPSCFSDFCSSCGKSHEVLQECTKVRNAKQKRRSGRPKP
ncbi:hypothetical protein EDD17DRAFT_764154 [Pisolithus thermaeus]|nr:hypothetical protein EDD17DRAFT_764154 [Pisolithus thermaeus]